MLLKPHWLSWAYTPDSKTKRQRHQLRRLSSPGKFCLGRHVVMVGCPWTALTLNQWKASEGPEKSQAKFVHFKAGSHQIPTQHIPGPIPCTQQHMPAHTTQALPNLYLCIYCSLLRSCPYLASLILANLCSLSRAPCFLKP